MQIAAEHKAAQAAACGGEQPCFDKSWSDDQVMAEVSRVARGPLAAAAYRIDQEHLFGVPPISRTVER